ncbi:TPA: glycosyltransferase [Streptococcus suis]|uniref:Glycosyltransferase n=1 Tax=Streptococcus suis TaxID=1307 RepID=A0A1C9IGA2_STRSU|nr:Glycosyltransferase [Streptococcus suis]HEP1805352.1 glycosyltransferase [Streptococcus suis]
MLVCVVGNFGDKSILTDGQGIKTLELYNSLVKAYGQKEVSRVNLHSKNRIILALQLLVNVIKCKNIIVLVSKNGRKTVIPLLVAYNRIFHKKIFHSLIGSTTHQTLEENPKLIECYNRLAGNWSETNTEKKLLEELGLTNVTVVKNFKNLRVLMSEELNYITNEPFPLCTFSRVEELKGIPNIVRAVNKVNELLGRTVCTLDIYGKVMERYEDDFAKLKSEFGENIRYRGVVDFDKSVETLKNYYMVVFPTRYYTEGIPGTLLDSFAAGVPVLSAEWESCYDIINENVGVTYVFNDDDALVNALIYSLKSPSEINKMKKGCLLEASKYSSEEITKSLGTYLEGE